MKQSVGKLQGPDFLFIFTAEANSGFSAYGK